MAGHDKPKTGLQRKTPLSRSPIKRKTTRKCAICRQEFAPWRKIQPTCGQHECEVAYALSTVEKAARKRNSDEQLHKKAERHEIKARKEKIKTRSEWMKEAQTEFNRWIRARDAGMPCICCGKVMQAEANSIDCGHYRSTGSAPHLRFHEDNAHAQDKQCNRWGAGRAVDYRIGLIARIGLERVEALEADNEPRKYDIAALRSIRDHYRALTRQLLREKS